jgi:hypothetical protein
MLARENKITEAKALTTEGTEDHREDEPRDGALPVFSVVLCALCGEDF